jgi:hypothetical protein
MIGFAPSGTVVDPVKLKVLPFKSRYLMNCGGAVYDAVWQTPLLQDCELSHMICA